MAKAVIVQMKQTHYPISAKCCISYRNQSSDLLCKSKDWFLYEMPHKAKMS